MYEFSQVNDIVFVVCLSMVTVLPHFFLFFQLLPFRDDTELNGVVEGRSIGARDGILLVVADKSGLVEDGAIAADEAPLGGLDHSTGIVLNGEADVEHLASVGDIGVVAVLLSLAGEAQVKGNVEEGLGISGELVALVGGSVLLGHGEVASHAGGEDDGTLGEHVRRCCVLLSCGRTDQLLDTDAQSRSWDPFYAKDHFTRASILYIFDHFSALIGQFGR